VLQHYFLVVGLSLLIFSVFYALLMRKATNFVVNRFFLLTAPLAASSFAFIQYEWVEYIDKKVVKQEIISEYLTNPYETPIVTSPPVSQPIDWEGYLIWGMFVVTALLLARILITVARIASEANGFQVFSRSVKVVTQSDSRRPIASFFNVIFWNDNVPAEFSEIIHQHELAHVELRHSFDKVLMEVWIAFFWWHPAIYFMRRQLHEVHEFEADSRAIAQTNINAYRYAQIIVEVASQSSTNRKTSPIHNNFNSLIKKRLTMLGFKKTNKTLSLIKSLLALPLVLVISALLSFSSRQQINWIYESGLPATDAPQAQAVAAALPPINLPISIITAPANQPLQHLLCLNNNPLQHEQGLSVNALKQGQKFTIAHTNEKSQVAGHYEISSMEILVFNGHSSMQYRLKTATIPDRVLSYISPKSKILFLNIEFKNENDEIQKFNKNLYANILWDSPLALPVKRIYSLCINFDKSSQNFGPSSMRLNYSNKYKNFPVMHLLDDEVKKSFTITTKDSLKKCEVNCKIKSFDIVVKSKDDDKTLHVIGGEYPYELKKYAKEGNSLVFQNIKLLNLEGFEEMTDDFELILQDEEMYRVSFGGIDNLKGKFVFTPKAFKENLKETPRFYKKAKGSINWVEITGCKMNGYTMVCARQKKDPTVNRIFYSKNAIASPFFDPMVDAAEEKAAYFMDDISFYTPDATVVKAQPLSVRIQEEPKEK
jgi:hypothetical protein